MEIIAFERWNFLVWKRYWPLYSRIYIYCKRHTAKALATATLCWAVRYDDYLLFFINFIERKVHAALSIKMQPYLEKMMVGTSRVAGIFICLCVVFFFILFSSIGRHNKCCDSLRQKNGSEQFLKIVYFFICVRTIVHAFLYAAAHKSFVASFLSLEICLIFINNMRWQTFYGNGPLFCGPSRRMRLHDFCIFLRAKEMGQKKKKWKKNQFCEKNTWVLA